MSSVDRIRHIIKLGLDRILRIDKQIIHIRSGRIVD